MKLPKAFLLIGIAWSMLGMSCAHYKSIYREYKPEACFDESKIPKEFSYEVAPKELIPRLDKKITVIIKQEETCIYPEWHNYTKYEKQENKTCYEVTYDDGSKPLFSSKKRVRGANFVVVKKDDNNLVLLGKHADSSFGSSDVERGYEVTEKYLFNKIYDTKCLTPVSEWKVYQGKED